MLPRKRRKGEETRRAEKREIKKEEDEEREREREREKSPEATYRKPIFGAPDISYCA